MGSLPLARPCLKRRGDVLVRSRYRGGSALRERKRLRALGSAAGRRFRISFAEASAPTTTSSNSLSAISDAAAIAEG